MLCQASAATASMPEAPVVAAPPGERETEAAAATARPGAWARYRPILGSRLLTLASWALFLGGAPASMMAALGLAGAPAVVSVVAGGAVVGVLRRETKVDELVMMAIAAALIVGEYLSAGLSVFVMLSGKVLERVTAARAEHAIEGLGQLVPAVARVKDAAD